MMSYNAITVTDAFIGSISRSVTFLSSATSYIIWGSCEEPSFHINITDAISTLDVIDAFIVEKKASMMKHKTLEALVQHLQKNMNIVRTIVADIDYKKCMHENSMFRYWSKVDCEPELNELQCLMKKIDNQFEFMMSLVRTFSCDSSN